MVNIFISQIFMVARRITRQIYFGLPSSSTYILATSRSTTRTESIKVSAEPRWQFIILNDDCMQIQRDQLLKALRRQMEGCDVNATPFVSQSLSS